MEKSFKDGEIVICNILKTPIVVKMLRFKTRDENRCYVINSNFEIICVDKKYIHRADIEEINPEPLAIKKNKISFYLTAGFSEMVRRRKSKYKVIKVKVSPVLDAYILCSDIKIGESKKIAPITVTVYPSGRFLNFKDEVSKSWAALHNKQYSV